MNASLNKALLVEGPIARTLFFFMLPVLMGNVLQSLNGSINAMWIGHYLGEAALTAASNSNTILFFLIGTVFGVGMAAAILIGQAMGSEDIDEAKRVVGTSVVFFVTLSLLVALLGYIFSPHLMTWMHTPADAQPLAVAYLRIIFLAIPFLFTYTFIMMVLRGAGDSRTPFMFLMVSVVLDIGLNPVFIFGLGPFPKMGIAGSATATLIAQVVSLAGLVTYLYRTKHFLCLHRGEGRYLRLDPEILGALVKKGLPMGLQMIVVSLSMIVLMALVNRFGVQTSAAYGACFQLWNYIQMPAMAVGMAASSMAAQNVGAKRWDRVDRLALTGVLYNILMTGAVVLLLELFSRQAFALFLPTDAPALEIAQHANRIVAWSFIFFGIMFVLAGVVRATGAVIPPLIILIISLWVVRIPFAYGLAGLLGVDAVWYCFPLGSLTSMLLSLLYYRFGQWRSAQMMSTHHATVASAAA